MNYSNWFLSIRILPFPASLQLRVNASRHFRMSREDVESVLKGRHNLLYGLFHCIPYTIALMITAVILNKCE